jgi:2'-hydroxyisoflavone reductase
MQKTRREFVKNGLKIAAATPLLGTGLLSFTEKEEKKSLRILILGGTSFLGPHQIAYALGRGHSISTFTRGKTKPTIYKDLYDKVDMLVGDRENDLSALEKGEWDIVIDNSGSKTEWTKKTANLLKDRAGLYIYTSSTGVYYPYLGEDINENTKVLLEEPTDIVDEETKLEYWYGVMKATSEIETIKAFGKDRSIIVRPTYMMGPADKTDRFIYWPLRFARGGDIMVPGPDDPVQFIDVRDVAEFMIRMAEEKKAGTFNAVGPVANQTMLEFAEMGKQAFAIESNLVPIDDDEFLNENGIFYLIPWINPVGNNYGTARVSNKRAIKAGLTHRDLKTSLKDMHQWWYSEALTDEKRDQFELNPEGVLVREKKVLENWQAHQNK